MLLHPARAGSARRSPWPTRTAASIIILLVLGGAATGLLLRRQADAAALDQLSSNADLAATYIAEQMAGLQSVVGVWSSSERLRALVEQAGDDPLDPAGLEDATTLMDAIRTSHTGIATSFLTDARAITLAAGPRNPDVIGRDFGDREWFRVVTQTGQPHVSSAYRAATGNRSWRVAASAPIRGDGGTLIAVVGATYEVAVFQAFAEDYAAERGGVLRLTDADDLVLAESGAAASGESLPADPLAGHPSGPSIRDGDDRTFVVRRPVEGTGWTLTVAVPGRVALASSNRLLTGLGVAVGVGVLLTAGLALTWHRSALAERSSDRRLIQQTRSVHAISPVGLVEASADGELTWVNEAFAAMIGQRAAELVGRRCADLLHPGEQDLAPLEVDPGLGCGTPDGERVFAHADGSPVTALVRSTVLRRDDGAVLRIVGVVTDISARAAAAEALRAAQERAQVLWDRAPIGVMESTSDGVITHVNDAMAHLMRAQVPDLVGLPVADLVDPADRPAQARAVAGLRRGTGYVAQRRYLALDGTPVPILVSTAALHDAEGEVDRLTAFVVDMSELHEQREALIRAGAEAREATAFLQAVLDASPDVVVVEDAVTGARSFTSHPTDLEVVHPDDAADLHAARLAAAQLPDGEIAVVDYRLMDDVDGLHWRQRRMTPFSPATRTGSRAPGTVLSTIRDITELVDAEQRLIRAALHDPLTGLANRVLLADRLDIAISQAARSGQEIAVLLCDLDGFKPVNDGAGHSAGDAVLVAIAERLTTLLRPGDTIARVGGDEFVVLLSLPSPDEMGIEASRSIARKVADRICQVIAVPVEFDGRSHVVTTSVGIAYASPSTEVVGSDRLLHEADTAMYRAKARGRGQVEVFDREDATADAPAAGTGSSLDH